MSSYLIWKSIHLLGVVLFLGNIVVTAWWKWMADRQDDPLVVAFSQRQVTLTDYFFTCGGVLLILLGGISMSGSMDTASSNWLSVGTGLFIASGIIWAVVLVPVQIKQARMAKRFKRDCEIPTEYRRLSRIWLLWGGVATLLPLLNLYFMVFKPDGI